MVKSIPEILIEAIAKDNGNQHEARRAARSTANRLRVVGLLAVAVAVVIVVVIAGVS